MLLPALATHYFNNPFIDTVKGQVYLPSQLSADGLKKKERKKKTVVVLCAAVHKQLTVHSCWIPFSVQQSPQTTTSAAWALEPIPPANLSLVDKNILPMNTFKYKCSPTRRPS